MKYRFLRFPDFRAKAVTASFDDGAIQDKKLIDIMNAHGIKGTFNICGSSPARTGDNVLTNDDLKSIYFPNGHEVANHGMNHKALINLSAIDGIHEVSDGRESLERFYGRIIRGFAYPDRTESNDEIKAYLKMLGTAYARTGHCTGTFALPKDFLFWQPTCKHNMPDAPELARKFLDEKPTEKYYASRDSILYYVWGHSFECPDRWKETEALFDLLGGHEDIWYATNIEICDYINAYKSLIFSVGNSLVYNPTLIKVYFDWDDTHLVIAPGETLSLK